MRKVDLKDNLRLKLDEEIELLQNQIPTADDVDKKRLQSMIDFRKSTEAVCGYEQLTDLNASDYIERACAHRKQIAMSEEDVSAIDLDGHLLEKIAAKYSVVSQLYRFINSSAKRANRSMGREGTSGVLGGYVTDGFYQSPKLFPEFDPPEEKLNFFEALKRNTAGTVEMRNRYRRVMKLSLSKDRIAYFKRQKAAGSGTPENPIMIASIGGGTGSLEMDLQQYLKEDYGIHSCIVIFDVVDQNRKDGSFFAKMRGARIYWIIQRPGVDDMLTRKGNGTLTRFLSHPLRGVDADGNDVRLAAGSNGLFHHVIMSGLWANFNDTGVLDFMAITKMLLCRGGQAVVTLAVNTYSPQPGRERFIPSMQIIDHLGHANGGVWYRSIASLKKRKLLERGGFAIRAELNGPIFPVIAIAPV